MATTFTNEDLKQIAALGLTQADVDKQIENFRKGFPKTQLIQAATVENGGILRLDDDQINHYAALYRDFVIIPQATHGHCQPPYRPSWGLHDACGHSSGQRPRGLPSRPAGHAG